MSLGSAALECGCAWSAAWGSAAFHDRRGWSNSWIWFLLKISWAIHSLQTHKVLTKPANLHLPHSLWSWSPSIVPLGKNTGHIAVACSSSCLGPNIDQHSLWIPSHRQTYQMRALPFYACCHVYGRWCIHNVKSFAFSPSSGCFRCCFDSRN